jgi:SAM-dependent methyltransferase
VSSMPSERIGVTDTLSFYEKNAKSYFDNTVAIDISGLRERFATYVPAGGLILDAGSGSGRDTRAFLRLGYEVEAFDASPALTELSTRLTGVRTRVMRFEDFDEPSRFDGIWACASLLHVSEEELPGALERLTHALKAQGAIYVSFKEGIGERTVPDGRRFTNLTLQGLELLLHSLTNLVIRELWSYKAQSSSKEDEVWVNAIATRV